MFLSGQRRSVKTAGRLISEISRKSLGNLSDIIIRRVFQKCATNKILVQGVPEDYNYYEIYTGFLKSVRPGQN
jgi:hypothetical protein